MRLPVCIPTVSPERDVYLGALIDQLGRARMSDITVEYTNKRKYVPGWKTQGIVAQRALKRTIKTWPKTQGILYLEDDVMLSERLTLKALEEVVLLNEVTTLYLAGMHQYPAQAQAQYPDFEGLVRLDDEVTGRWYGSQALYLPRWMVHHLVSVKLDDVNALDYEVRDFLTSTENPLYVVVPNLVQHRKPESIDRTRPGQHESEWFL